MSTAIERNDFMPPPEPAAAQSFGLALLAHGLLIAALAWGINWQKQATTAGVEAELWSSMPQEAAPPPPPPAPVVATPPPAPAPAPKVEAPPPPAPKPPDISIEREKQRKLAEAKKREAEEEALKQKKLAALKAEQQKKQREDEARKAREEETRLAKEKATRDKARQQADAQRLEALRQENLKRMLASAGGGSGAPDAKGTAARASGPSASYAGRIIARVKPNIVYPDEVSGNPSAEVEVRVAPDGTIVGKRLVKPSGVKSWDDAVLRALDRTETLPRDTDGSVHSPMIIEFRPKS